MRSKFSNSSGGLKLTRRSFVTAAGVVVTNPSLVAWAEDAVPPKFVRSSNLYILRRQEAELWVIDRRWFDVSGGGISIEAGGNQLRISDFWVAPISP